MYKVLLADDEPWIIYGLKQLINWESMGYTLIGEAYNGVEALDKIRIEKPDVLITDIRMPGLNGIDLIRTLKEEQLDVKTILISGYAEFEYAQKALQLGAYDYLLKQVNEHELTVVLEKLKLDLEKHKANIASAVELSLDELFELMDPSNRVKTTNFMSARGFSSLYPHYRFITCLFSDNKPETEPEPTLLGNEIYYIRLKTGRNKYSYLLNYDEWQHPLVMLTFIEILRNASLNIGISSLGTYSTTIHQLFQESDIALYGFFICPGQKLTEYKKVDSTDKMFKQMLEIEVAIKGQNSANIERIVDEIYEFCKSELVLLDEVAKIYNQFMFLIYKQQYRSKQTEEIEYLDSYQLLRLYSDIDQLFQHIKAMMEPNVNHNIHYSNDFIGNIIEFINANYTEEMLLSDLAKKFNFSLGYLSTYIKRETGKTYTEYVTEKRLQLAKELLQDNTLSIEEIVYKVGYKDYFHFNKIFKKYVGVTPSKFRKL